MARRVLPLLLAIGACRPAVSTPPSTVDPPPAVIVPDVAPPAPADEVIAALERRVLAAGRVHVIFEVESHGAVETKLRGILVLAPDGRAQLEAQGTFAGVAGVAKLECDGKTLRGSSGTARLELPCPAGLRPALLLGWLRMGVLHNVARAWSAKPPDHADSEPTDAPNAQMDAWVTTGAHRRPVRSEAERTPTHFDAVSFELSVDGTSVGEATLHLDAEGNPAEREQTVHFPSGDMTVVERYESVEITPPAT